MSYPLNRLYSDLVALASEAQAHALRSEGITSREVRGELYPYLVNAEDCGLAIVEWYADLWKEAAECKLAVERFIYTRLGISYLAFCELGDDELVKVLDGLQEQQPDLAQEILDYVQRWHPKVAAELRHRLRPKLVESQPASTVQQPEHAYQADATVPKSAKVWTRRRKKGEAKTILVAALCEWHGFSDGGCNRTEPIEVSELARRCDMTRSTVSSFFKTCFEGHDEYRRRCSEPGELVFSLKLLRGEVLPRHFKQHYSEPSDQDNDD